MEPNSTNQPVQPIEHKKVGPIVVTLVVVLVLVIVALYIFASNISQQNTPDMTNSATDTSATTQIQSVPTVTNTADDPQSLQDDLNKSVDGIDNQSL